MRANHYVGGLMMMLPAIAWMFVQPPILFAFLIAFPIGWQLFFSNGERDKRKHRAF